MPRLANPSIVTASLQRTLVGLCLCFGCTTGTSGSFAVVHRGVMDGAEKSLVIAIVPNSGLGQLAGIAGTMSIDIVDRQHFYTIAYTLPDC